MRRIIAGLLCVTMLFSLPGRSLAQGSSLCSISRQEQATLSSLHDYATISSEAQKRVGVYQDLPRISGMGRSQSAPTVEKTLVREQTYWAAFFKKVRHLMWRNRLLSFFLITCVCSGYTYGEAGRASSNAGMFLFFMGVIIFVGILGAVFEDKHKKRKQEEWRRSITYNARTRNETIYRCLSGPQETIVRTSYEPDEGSDATGWDTIEARKASWERYLAKQNIQYYSAA